MEDLRNTKAKAQMCIQVCLNASCVCSFIYCMALYSLNTDFWKFV